MIIAATLAILIGMWANRQIPIKPVKVDYCFMEFPGSDRRVDGEHSMWIQGYGPCSALDRFENI